MQLLVTGATGFVGRMVCSELAQHGHRVRAAVRNPRRAGNLPGEILIVGDFDAQTQWSEALRSVDVIVHLAARVHVMKDTAADPLAEFRAVNVLVTQSLARAAAERGVRRLVYVSSIKVNGETTGNKPFTERDQPNPQDPYGVSKWEAEQSLWTIAHHTGLEVVVVRPPLVYGPNVGGNFLRLMKFVRSGLPLPFEAIENRRSMIYKNNLVAALIACATEAAAAGKTYLVCDGEDVSTPNLIAEMASLMGRVPRLWSFPPKLLQVAGKLTGKGSEVERLIGSLQIDSSRIRNELRWTPPFSFGKGLEETVRWFLEEEPIAS